MLVLDRDGSMLTPNRTTTSVAHTMADMLEWVGVKPPRPRPSAGLAAQVAPLFGSGERSTTLRLSGRHESA